MKWVSFGIAARTIADRFGMSVGLAEKTLRDLCASGEVRSYKAPIKIEGNAGVLLEPLEPIAPSEWRAGEVDFEVHVAVDEDDFNHWIESPPVEPKVRKRVAPKRDLAKKAIEELWPEVPPQSKLSNKRLCDQVRDYLKVRGHSLSMHDDTILRPAGRK